MPRPWWIESVARRLGRRSPRAKGRSLRPELETLGDRITPAAVTYNTGVTPATLSIVLDADSEELSIESLGAGVVRYTTTDSFSGGKTGSSFDLTVASGSTTKVSITDAPTITFGVVKFLDSGSNVYPSMPVSIDFDNNSGGVQFDGTTNFGPSPLKIIADTTISMKPSAVLLTTTDLLLEGDRLDIQNATSKIPGSVDAYIDAGSAKVTIRPATDGQEINIGGDDYSGFLGLTDDELDRITAGRIEIGSTSAGNAKITAPISPAKTSALSITTGEKLFLYDDPNNPAETFPADATAITVAKLTLSSDLGSGTGVARIPIDVDNLEAKGLGSVFVSNTGDLTIGGAEAPNQGMQVTKNFSTINVQTSGTITVNERITADGGITLTATGATSDIILQHNAAGGVSAGGGNTKLQAGRNVLIGTATGLGDVEGQGLTINAGGDVVVDHTSYVEANGAAGMGITASGDIKLLHSQGSGSHFKSNGIGDITITPGAGKTFVFDPGSGGFVSATSGAITIDADNMTLTSGTIGTTGLVTLAPATANREISFGTEVSGKLSLTQSELNLVTIPSPGVVKLQVGDATTGPITLAADIVRSSAVDLTLKSGSPITPSTSAGAINTAGGSLTYSPGGLGYQPYRYGTDATTGTAKLVAGSILSIAINGTTADNSYSQFVVAGAVDLGGATLALPAGSFVPTLGQSFAIVSGTSITGEFAGLADGAIIPFNGKSLRITYGASTVTLTGADVTAPDTTLLTSPGTPTGDNTPTVTFSGTDDVNGSGVASYQVSVDGGAPVSITATSFTASTLSDGSHTIEVAAVDVEGNVDATPASYSFVVDTSKPTVGISAPSQTLAKPGDTITYTITYTDTNFNASTLTSKNITLLRTGTARGTVTLLPGSGAMRTVTITNIKGNGTLGISVAAGTATDTLGNLALASGQSATIAVDSTPPKVIINRLSAVSVAAGGPMDFIVTYRDTNLAPATLTKDQVTLVSTRPVTGTITVTQLNATQFQVTVSDIVGSGKVRIAVAAGAAQDLNGNLSLGPIRGPKMHLASSTIR